MAPVDAAVNDQVLTLDLLVTYVREQAARSQKRIDAHYREAMRHALSGLAIPGVTVVLGDAHGRKRPAGPAMFFPTGSWAKPVIEEMTLELTVVLEDDLLPTRPWWRRALRQWRPGPEPRTQIVRIACPITQRSEGTITVNGHLLRRFSMQKGGLA